MKGLLQLFCVKLRAREPKRSVKHVRSQRNLTIVQLIYNEVEMALWAIGAALLFYFLLFVLPKLPETSNYTELQRIQEINAENERFCQTLHMGEKSPMHDECFLALGQLRKDIEKRYESEHEF